MDATEVVSSFTVTLSLKSAVSESQVGRYPVRPNDDDEYVSTVLYSCDAPVTSCSLPEPLAKSIEATYQQVYLLKSLRLRLPLPTTRPSMTFEETNVKHLPLRIRACHHEARRSVPPTMRPS